MGAESSSKRTSYFGFSPLAGAIKKPARFSAEIVLGLQAETFVPPEKVSIGRPKCFTIAALMSCER